MAELSLGGTFNLAGFEVPRIGYGMGGISRTTKQGSQQYTDAVELLNTAFELGIRHFDTAQFYENGLANELLRDAFSDRRQDVCLVSKVGARTQQGFPPMTATQKPEEIHAAIEKNLETLGTDYLDMVYLRRMDFQPSLIAEGEQQVDIQIQLDTLADLCEQGVIRGIGLSHVTLEQAQQGLSVGIDAISNIHTMLYHVHDELLEFAREHNIAWAPYFPVGGASYFDLPRVAEHPTVIRIAQELGATPTQIAMKWQLENSPNTLLITGTSSKTHLRENAAASDIELTQEQFHTLQQVSKNYTEYFTS